MTYSGLLTTAEVAKIRGVKRATVSVWCRKGVIPRQFVTRTSRFGDYRISAAWLESQEMNYGPTPGVMDLARRDLEEVMKVLKPGKNTCTKST